MARRAPALGDVQATEPLARAAALLPRHRQLALAAAHRILERDVDGLMEIGAASGRGFLPGIALPDHVGEQVAEGRRRVAAHAGREVEALEAVRRRFGTRSAWPRVSYWRRRSGSMSVS